MENNLILPNFLVCKNGLFLVYDQRAGNRVYICIIVLSFPENPLKFANSVVKTFKILWKAKFEITCGD